MAAQVKNRHSAHQARYCSGQALLLPAWESLEARRLLATPSDIEQYMLELINRARANPPAEASRLGIALNEGLAAGTITTAAKQPLAFSPDLIDAARQHSQEMLDFDYFSHTGRDGSTPWGRMANAGYAPVHTFSAAENIAWTGSTGSLPNTTTATAHLHEGLFTDEDITGRGHRLNLMDADLKEIGIGIRTGNFASQGKAYIAVMITQDFAALSAATFLTGVVYNDSVQHDDFYTPGEGLAGVTISASQGVNSFQTTTFSTGGYSLQLAPGTYTVTASGPGLSQPIIFSNVVIGTENVERDVQIGGSVATDTMPPAAKLSAGKITSAGGKSATFTVTYSDNVAVAINSLNHGELIVVGPKGDSIPVSFVKVDVSSNGTPRKATYRISAPGGLGMWPTTAPTPSPSSPA
jgi:serralysin